jgi:hypothetical protein
LPPAKGTAEFAKLDDVIFQTVNGQKLAALYNLKAIRRGAYNDPEVFVNDVVVSVIWLPGGCLLDALQLSVTTRPVVALQQNQRRVCNIASFAGNLILYFKKAYSLMAVRSALSLFCVVVP